jgi:hypothetical protein
VFSEVLTWKELGFEVLMAVSMKMAVFWVVVPCSLVEAIFIEGTVHSEFVP